MTIFKNSRRVLNLMRANLIPDSLQMCIWKQCEYKNFYTVDMTMMFFPVANRIMNRWNTGRNRDKCFDSPSNLFDEAVWCDERLNWIDEELAVWNYNGEVSWSNILSFIKSSLLTRKAQLSEWRFQVRYPTNACLKRHIYLRLWWILGLRGVPPFAVALRSHGRLTSQRVNWTNSSETWPR